MTGVQTCALPILTQGMRVEYSIMCDETEKILQQVVTPAEAKKIIDFVRTKKAVNHKIGKKTFQTENYIFDVDGDDRTVNIYVCNK